MIPYVDNAMALWSERWFLVAELAWMSAFHCIVNGDLNSNIESTHIFEDNSAKTMGHKYKWSSSRLTQLWCKQLLSGTLWHYRRMFCSWKGRVSQRKSPHGRTTFDLSVVPCREYLRRNHRWESWQAELRQPTNPEAKEHRSRLSTSLHGGRPGHG